MNVNFQQLFVVVKMTERRKNQSEEWTYFIQLFIHFITVNKYRFCISVIGYINMQIIGISYKKINIDRSLITCDLGEGTTLIPQLGSCSCIETAIWTF